LNPFDASTNSERADVKYLIEASQTTEAWVAWFP